MTDPETIKDALRAAMTEEDVNAAAARHRAAVVALHASQDPADKPIYLQIINLKAIRLQLIRAGTP